MLELAALDDSSVAPHHVDSRPIAPPAPERAALDPEVDDARELQAIPVPVGPDVLDGHVAQGYMVRGGLEGATIVYVQSVAARAPDTQAVDDQPAHFREVHPFASTLQHGRIVGICGSEGNGLGLGTLDSRQVDVTRRHTRLDGDDLARFGGSEGRSYSCRRDRHRRFGHRDVTLTRLVHA